MRRRPRNHPSLDGLEKTEKRCRTCGEVKPLTPEFWPRDRGQPDGFQGWCKACKQAKQRADYTHEEARRRWLKIKYGITPERYDELLAEQGGCCAICGRPDPGQNTVGKFQNQRLHIDHVHGTGEVRGLLCSNCNRGVGCFLDNPEIMRKAIGYVEEWQARERGE